jgi:uncharacterized heparinase superfamily protein
MLSLVSASRAKRRIRGKGVEWGRDRWRLYGLALKEAFRALRTALARLVRVHRLVKAPSPERLLFAPQDLRTSDPTVASDIYAGLFVFAGRALTTGGRSPFQFTPPSQGWGEALYGFGWLRHLRAAGTALARANARALVAEFMAQRRDTPPLAGQTQVAARRLLAFLTHSPLLLEGADHEFYRRFMRSLGRTIRDLERDMRGGASPHARLVAAIALCYAGLCCEGFDRLLRRATRHLVRELDRQILADGGHASRNPRVLIDLLLDLLPLRQIYASRGLEPPKALVGAIDRMLPMLRLFRHGDGTLAHFNGMGVTAAHHLATILIYDEARAQPMQRAPHSGYERLQANAAIVTADVGPAPPVNQSREAHAGCLSFELSSGVHRIVVNCGASRAARGQTSLVSRATAAHSTATMAETSSCRFLAPGGWAAERRIAGWLQRRLGAVVLRGPAVVTAERSESGDAIDLKARHDSYRPGFGLSHERRWRLEADGCVLHGEDAFIPDRESAGPRDVAIRFHLHPSVRTSEAEDGLRLVLPNEETWIFAAHPVAWRMEESVFFSTTDRPRRTEQIVLAFNTRQADTVRWRFERMAPARGAEETT